MLINPPPKKNSGDSYSQTGFNIDSTKPSAGNPLGNPALPGWTASGGYNWVGFLTSRYNASTLLTYNFAHGGATTNASLVAPYDPSVLSMVDQVAQFSRSIAARPGYAPWTAANALVGVWMGVNDVGNSHWLANYYPQLVGQIIDTYFSQLQVLYDAGARNFVVLGVPRMFFFLSLFFFPLRMSTVVMGCMHTDKLGMTILAIQKTPAILGQAPEGQTSVANGVARYNDALIHALNAFAASNAGTNAVFVDTGLAFNKALDDPTAHGAPDATCYHSDGVSCLWFNDYHPGVEINRLVASAVADEFDDFFVGDEECEAHRV